MRFRKYFRRQFPVQMSPSFISANCPMSSILNSGLLEILTAPEKPNRFESSSGFQDLQQSSFLNCFNQCVVGNFSPVIQTLRGLFQNVIRHARIGSGYSVKNVIEWNLSIFLIAMLARLD